MTETMTETIEYKECVEKLQSLSPNFVSWLARKPSLQAVRTAISSIDGTDAEGFTVGGARMVRGDDAV